MSRRTSLRLPVGQCDLILGPHAVRPAKKTVESVGYDICADLSERGFSLELLPRQTLKIPTGIRMESIKPSIFPKLETRSSFAMRGFSVLGGIIDPDYRGEWFVCLTNLNKKWGEKLVITHGMPIAQMVFYTNISGSDETLPTRTGGFGSTDQHVVPARMGGFVVGSVGQLADLASSGVVEPGYISQLKAVSLTQSQSSVCRAVGRDQVDCALEDE